MGLPRTKAWVTYLTIVIWLDLLSPVLLGVLAGLRAAATRAVMK